MLVVARLSVLVDIVLTNIAMQHGVYNTTWPSSCASTSAQTESPNVHQLAVRRQQFEQTFASP